jgi:hypothetical protein
MIGRIYRRIYDYIMIGLYAGMILPSNPRIRIGSAVVAFVVWYRHTWEQSHL